jgi:hypothetical protein
LLKALAQAIERQKRLSWQFAGAKRRSLRVMRAKAPCAGTGIAREKATLHKADQCLRQQNFEK